MPNVKPAVVEEQDSKLDTIVGNSINVNVPCDVPNIASPTVVTSCNARSSSVQKVPQKLKLCLNSCYMREQC